MMRKGIHRAFGTFCAAAALSGTAVVPAFASAQRAAPDPLAHLTANQILTRAVHDTTALRSVHLYVKFSDKSGVVTEGMTLARQGCVITEAVPGPGNATILIIGKHAWMKPDDAFWEHAGFTGSDLASVSGKWIDLTTAFGGSAGPAAGALGCSLKILDSGLPRSGWTLGRPTRSQGITKLALTRKDKKDRETIVVSDTRRPLLLSDVVTLIKPQGRAAIYFGNFNAPITLTPPPPGDVLTSIPTPPGSPSPCPAPQVRTGRTVVAALRSLWVDGLVIR